MILGDNILQKNNRKGDSIINIKKRLCVLISLLFCFSAVSEKAEAKNTDVVALYEDWDGSLKQFTYFLCQDEDVDYETILAIIWNESRFQSDAVNENTNGTIDRGLMQINDSCVPFLIKNGLITNENDLFDAKTNIKCGVFLFKYHLSYTNNTQLALLRYQIGEGAFDEMILNGEYTTDDFLRVWENRNTLDSYFDTHPLFFNVFLIAEETNRKEPTYPNMNGIAVA